MQHYWLNRENNKKLIIFFGGWSFDYKPFEFLDCKDNDIIMFYDYNNIDFDFDFSGHEEINLIGWSMGVFVAYLLKDKLPKLNCKLAINGTPHPIHNEWGIPAKTFDLTLKHVNAGLSGKFYKNIFSNIEDYERYTQSSVQRPIENRASELSKLNELIKNTTINYEQFYTKVIISSDDKIIPAKNQNDFWTNQALIKNCTLLECGHFPYYNFKSWDEILLCK